MRCLRNRMEQTRNLNTTGCTISKLDLPHKLNKTKQLFDQEDLKGLNPKTIDQEHIKKLQETIRSMSKQKICARPWLSLCHLASPAVAATAHRYAHVPQPRY